jgi:hypothetical protein
VSDEKGLAVLFIYQPDGTHTADPFHEDGEFAVNQDPFHRAQSLWYSVKDDFPGALGTVAVNERARELMSRTRMLNWGFTEEDLDQLDEDDV